MEYTRVRTAFQSQIMALKNGRSAAFEREAVSIHMNGISDFALNSSQTVWSTGFYPRMFADKDFIEKPLDGRDISVYLRSEEWPDLADAMKTTKRTPRRRAERLRKRPQLGRLRRSFLNIFTHVSSSHPC